MEIIVKSCGFIVYNTSINHIRFLLLKHRNGGNWGFPKGMNEPHEDFMSTAYREVEEETGLVKTDLEMLENVSLTHSYNFTLVGNVILKNVYYYIAHTSKEEIQIGPEHHEFIWADYQKTQELLHFKEAQKLLEEANKSILQILQSHDRSF